MKTRILPEQNYAQTMDETVTPFVEERRTVGQFARVTGQPMNYEHIALTAEDEADTGHLGTIVLVHGFSEGIRKFYETVWYYVHLGYDVFLYQQRGHGLSYRATEVPGLIHITDYRDLTSDLHAFVQQVVRPAAAGKVVLYAHSMGGAVGADTIEHYPDDFDLAILTSPMLQLDPGKTPLWAAELAARCLILLGKGDGYMPGSQPWNPEPDFENSCTNCRERYDYWFREQTAHPEYQMGGASVRTSLEFLKLTRDIAKPANLARVKIPVLLFQAEKDGTVLPDGQNRFIQQIGDHGKLCVIRNAKHEIYRNTNDIMEEYWRQIEQFLAEMQV